MDRNRPELNTKDVQLPLLCLYPVLKRILQCVYGSSRGSAALQSRLVCRSFNQLMLKNVRIHLHYVIRAAPYRCRLSLKGSMPKGIIFPTDQLIDSSLIKRIVTMKVVRYNTDLLDKGDLVRLASGFSRPVDVSLFSSHNLPLLPLTEMPMMRVVEVEKRRNFQDLTQPELNFLAGLQHLNRLSMSRANVQQMSQRADLLNICELDIFENYSNVQNLDVDFIDKFFHLQTLIITGLNCQTDMPDFTGVKLPHLVKCDLFLVILSSFSLESELDGTKRLLTSMHSAMPKLKELKYSTKAPPDRFSDADQVAQLISVIFHFCPTTVEDFVLYGYTKQRLFVHSQLQLKWLLRTLFSSTLGSNITRVSLFSCFNPIMAARPFRYKKSRSGVQVGQPVAMVALNASVHRYLLKRPHGKISTLDVICWDR